MKSYTIHLIRNMPCQGNLEGRYIGRTESPLPTSSIQRLLELKREFRYPRAGPFTPAPPPAVWTPCGCSIQRPTPR